MNTLSKAVKDGMIRSIVADIPEEDFQAQGREFILEAVVAKLPPKVRAVWNDADLRPYIKTARISTGCNRISANVPWLDSWADAENVKAVVGQETWNTFLDYCASNTRQIETRRELYRTLEANFASVRTRKQFIERFPELQKYLPEDRSSPANLPATNDLMERLKAAGFEMKEAA